MTTLREKTWRALAEFSEPASSLDVSEKMGETQAIVSSCLSQLIRTGQATRTKVKVFRDDATCYTVYKYAAEGSRYIHHKKVPKAAPAPRKAPLVKDAAPKPTDVVQVVDDVDELDVALNVEAYKEYLEYKKFVAFRRMKDALERK